MATFHFCYNCGHIFLARKTGYIRNRRECSLCRSTSLANSIHLADALELHINNFLDGKTDARGKPIKKSKNDALTPGVTSEKRHSIKKAHEDTPPESKKYVKDHKRPIPQEIIDAYTKYRLGQGHELIEDANWLTGNYKAGSKKEFGFLIDDDVARTMIYAMKADATVFDY